MGLFDVWKKYSRRDVFHRSLRDDLANLFRAGYTQTLGDGEFWALKGLTLSVKQGESVGLYGPNGSGKTTTLKLIASVTTPTRGDVVVNGRVAPLIEVGAGFHPDLTGLENIYMNGAIIGMTLREISKKKDDIIAFSELESFIHMPIKKYSSGMSLRLGFSIAVHSEAEILLIDEMLAVADAAFQKKCIDKINTLRGKKTMLCVSHDRLLMERLVDRVVVLHQGAVSEAPAAVNS
jgi:ABC-type polysaccharide/polyol phosphate transport system ATPase subunit